MESTYSGYGCPKSLLGSFIDYHHFPNHLPAVKCPLGQMMLLCYGFDLSITSYFGYKKQNADLRRYLFNLKSIGSIFQSGDLWYTSLRTMGKSLIMIYSRSTVIRERD